MSATKVPDTHTYESPAKLIKNIDDMKIWERSEAYLEYLGFILAINDAIKGKSNSCGSENCSEAVMRVFTMLEKLDKVIDETPPVSQPQRFGNIAFRSWYQQLQDDALMLLQDVLEPNMYKAIPEIVSYLVDGFGNSTRIDYGTGHEISFIMFICCLFKIGLLYESDKVATGCKIFPKYLDVARKLQQTYRMEPAGSHGVWSLDDYQFVPFIWGSSQLFANPTIHPHSFLDQNVLDQNGNDYMFLTCINYINQVKTGPFAEHSNQLWSISGVSSWSKINGGLIKMYKAEVLCKFPVIQHIVFGTLFTLRAVEQSTGLMSAKTSMVPPPLPYRSVGSSEIRRDSSLRSLSKLSSEGIRTPSGRSDQDLNSITPASSFSTKSSDKSSADESFKTGSDRSSDKKSVESSSSKPSEETHPSAIEEESVDIVMAKPISAIEVAVDAVEEALDAVKEEAVDPVEEEAVDAVKGVDAVKEEAVDAVNKEAVDAVKEEAVNDEIKSKHSGEETANAVPDN